MFWLDLCLELFWSGYESRAGVASEGRGSGGGGRNRQTGDFLLPFLRSEKKGKQSGNQMPSCIT